MRKIKNESDLWKYLRAAIKPAIGGHWSRVESHGTALGIPDVNLYLSYQDVWIELKQGEDAEIRPSQYRWITDRIESGARNIWILYHDHNYGYMMIHGTFVGLLKEANHKSTWAACAHAIWKDEINPKELEALICPITKHLRKH